MDGTSYEISVGAQSVGVATAADELVALASALDTAAHVATSFDTAIARTEALLADASAAASSAADAVASGSSKYNQLESAAVRAARAVEKAALAGKDTAALEASAASASAAMAAQAAVLDELRAKSAAAASAQTQLAGALRTLQGAAKAEAAGLAAASREAEKLKQASTSSAPALLSAGAAGAKAGTGIKTVVDASKLSLGPMGGMVEKSGKLATLMAAGMGGAAVFAAGAIVSLSSAALLGVFSLAQLAVSLNKVASAKLDALAGKAKKSLVSMFAGVHVDKLVDGLTELEKSFDENSVSGQALKGIVSDLLNPLFDAIPKLIPYAKAFFQGMVIGALDVQIAVLKAYIAIKDMIPDSAKAKLKTLGDDIDVATTAMRAGTIVVGVLAAELAVLTVAALALGVIIASPFILGAAVIAATAAAVYGAIGALGQLKNWVSLAGAALSELGGAAWSAASSLVDGLVNGIKNGAGRVVEAVKSLGTSAVKSLNDALGNHSPSRYALEAAANVTHTFADTIDAGAPDARSAMSGLVNPRVAEGAGSGGGSARGGQDSSKSGNTFSIVINAPDGTAQGIASAVQLALTRCLEGDLTMGGAEVPT